MTVDIVCATYQGALYLPDFLRSLDAQTHEDWRLWVRDDGSTDSTVDIVRAQAARDARVRLLESGGSRLGAAQSFAWLLEHVPGDSTYVMCADQDDVWLPRKIEQTLAAMRQAETEHSPTTPLLVHTDLVVVDAQLRAAHPSFWKFAGLDPEPVSLRRFVVRNVTTGATSMLNRSLRELVGQIPPDAYFHDWWCACVAAAFGRVVAVHEPTVLYRQHSGNAVGAGDGRVSLRRLPSAIVTSVRGTSRFRRELRQTAIQARAFLVRYHDGLGDEDRAFLEAYARIPEQPFLSRKRALLRLRRLPEHGVLRTLGVLLRG